jgi:hypothetical protein
MRYQVQALIFHNPQTALGISMKLFFLYLQLIGVGILAGAICAGAIYFFGGNGSGKKQLMLVVFLVPSVGAMLYSLWLWLEARKFHKQKRDEDNSKQT